MVKNIRSSEEPVKIGIVGKYFGTGDFTLADSYLSVIEAIKYAAWSLNRKPEITWLHDSDLKSTKEVATFYGGASDEVFVDFLLTLGLRKYEGAGEDKAAFQVLRSEAKARGF